MNLFYIVFTCIYGNLFIINVIGSSENNTRTFTVDYTNNQFLKDGKPFRYVAGDMHYFRVMENYWYDRLCKFRAARLNAVQMYIYWALHEPLPGKYNFDGNLDFVKFIKIAQELGLLVLLRPGPYISAEADYGGYPGWLLTADQNIQLRSTDPTYQKYVEKWFDVLLPKIKPLLYENGGPVIMVQVENEYGYIGCDPKYLNWLYELIKSYLGDGPVYYTNNGPSKEYLSCGSIPGVLSTVDNGPVFPSTNSAFQSIRDGGQKNGPLVNSEFYSGILSWWGKSVLSYSNAHFANALKQILAYDNTTSVAIYMFHGGTNFNFMSGANCITLLGYLPVVTSYDYDAPIAEDGRFSEKYHIMKNILKDYFPDPKLEVNDTVIEDYGSVTLEPLISLSDYLKSTDSITHQYPLSFENIGHYYGYVLYETVLSGSLSGTSTLYAPQIRDRGHVFLDNKQVGIVSRFLFQDTLSFDAQANQKLSILVENLGRVSFGSNNETKGIICQPLLNKKPLENWKMTPVNFDIDRLDDILDDIKNSSRKSFDSQPGFYSSSFQLKTTTTSCTPLDTHLNLMGWNKGVVFINGHNIGRYWNIGPQKTLYVPGPYLKPYPENNTLIIFELEKPSSNFSVYFQNFAILNDSVGIGTQLSSLGSTCSNVCPSNSSLISDIISFFHKIF